MGYGYPQIPAEDYVVNHSWDKNAQSLGMANGVGLMVYEGSSSLNYVTNYAEATQKYESFPIKVDVPWSSILVGCKGGESSTAILTLANEAVKQNLHGVMVWYASVINGFHYSEIY